MNNNIDKFLEYMFVTGQLDNNKKNEDNNKKLKLTKDSKDDQNKENNN